MTDILQDTLERGKNLKSLDAIKMHMKDGEEPEEILLSLVSSPLIDLQDRELAKILTAEDGSRKVVLAVFYDADWIDGKGIVRVGKRKEG